VKNRTYTEIWIDRMSYGGGGGGIQNVIQYPVCTVPSAAVCKKPALSCSGTEKELGRVH